MYNLSIALINVSHFLDRWTVDKLDGEPVSILAGVLREAQTAILSVSKELADIAPDLANLRCLEGSVRNLIARLCRHDGSVLRDCIPTTGTISGDLYATIAAIVGNRWDNDALSDLQRRYPLPKPIDAAQARHDGGGELPPVPCEVSDGGGSPVDRGVCGSADVEPALTEGQQELCELFDAEFPDKSGLAMQIEAARPLSVKARKVTAEQFEADLLSIINAAKERNTYTADMVQAMLLHCHSAAGPVDSAPEQPPAWMQEALEQARSTTRRNILKAVDHLNGKLPEKWDVPEQDIAVAMVALRQSIKAEHAGDHKASIMERFAFDQMREAENKLKDRELTLRGAIKGRDGKIKDLQAQVDKLARHIAFQVAK